MYLRTIFDGNDFRDESKTNVSQELFSLRIRIILNSAHNWYLKYEHTNVHE